MYKFLIFAGAAAAQLAVIQSALQPVSTAVQSLDDGIKNIQGPGDAQNVINLSNKVQQALQQANGQAQGAQPIGIGDAITLAQTTAQLNTLVSTTIMDLIGKKQIIVQANQQQTTENTLQQQNNAAQALAQTITSKVPAAVQNIAQQQAAQISQSLQMGIQAFQN